MKGWNDKKYNYKILNGKKVVIARIHDYLLEVEKFTDKSKLQIIKIERVGNVLSIFFSLLMCYWLIIPSVLFLVAKIIDGILALALGGYLYISPGPDSFAEDKGKVINGYWGYTLTDTVICFCCFILSVLGVPNG